MVSGPTAACACSAAVRRPRREQARKRRRRPVGKRVAGDDELHAGRHHGLDRAAIGLSVGGEDEARREQVEDVSELAEIVRDQRIGRRDRRVGNADIHGGKADERVLDIVAGEDRDRPLGREIAREQGCADAADGGQRLAVTDPAPAAGRVALGEVGALRGPRGPIVEPLGQLLRVGRKRVRRLEVERPVRPALDDDVARAEADRPHRRRRGDLGTTLFDRCRHRFLRSGVSWARSCRARPCRARLWARASRERP